MTSTWSVIHFLARHLSKLHASIQNIYSLIHRWNWHLDQFFNVNFPINFLSHLQVFAQFGIQQIKNLILINLVKAQMNSPLDHNATIFLPFQNFNNIINTLRYYSLTDHIQTLQYSHGMCLPCPRLPIDKIRAIIPI